MHELGMCSSCIRHALGQVCGHAHTAGSYNDCIDAYTHAYTLFSTNVYTHVHTHVYTHVYTHVRTHVYRQSM